MEGVQFSVLAIFVVIYVSFLMLLTGMLQRLKTGEHVVRESLSLSYREGSDSECYGLQQTEI